MTAGMVELCMNVGKLNGLNPKKLMAMVNVADRESSIDIGRINIVKMQAYFEVPRSESQGVIDSFAKSHIAHRLRRPTGLRRHGRQHAPEARAASGETSGTSEAAPEKEP